MLSMVFSVWDLKKVLRYSDLEKEFWMNKQWKLRESIKGKLGIINNNLEFYLLRIQKYFIYGRLISMVLIVNFFFIFVSFEKSYFNNIELI